MTIKVLIGVSIGLTLLVAGCNLRANPIGAPTSAAQSSVATATSPALTSPEAAVSPEASESTEPSGPPKPNPLPAVGQGGNKDFAAVAGSNVTANGAAATIHGLVTAGKVLFAQNCQTCHGVDGKGGIPNPNSADGTVPTLNPIDPGFITSPKGDPAIFAAGVDLFIQHGSLPAGPGPTFSMSGWGDQNKLTQQQIADVEAFVMQLNGVTWPAG